MKLFSITDAPSGENPVDGDFSCVAVWAEGEADALAFGAKFLEEPPLARVVSVSVADWVRPEKDSVHQETREEVLRQAGWREEGDDYCCECELHDMNREEWRACFECGLCPDCSKSKGDGYDCDGCNRQVNGEAGG